MWKEARRTAKDPICGMTLSEKNVRFKREHIGTTYYFCSAKCKQKFDADPNKYAK